MLRKLMLWVIFDFTVDRRNWIKNISCEHFPPRFFPLWTHFSSLVNFPRFALIPFFLSTKPSYVLPFLSRRWSPCKITGFHIPSCLQNHSHCFLCLSFRQTFVAAPSVSLQQYQSKPFDLRGIFLQAHPPVNFESKVSMSLFVLLWRWFQSFKSKGFYWWNWFFAQIKFTFQL